MLAEDAASAMNPTQKKYSKFELANTLTGHNIKIANIIWFACLQPDTANTDVSFPIKNAKIDNFCWLSTNADTKRKNNL